MKGGLLIVLLLHVNGQPRTAWSSGRFQHRQEGRCLEETGGCRSRINLNLREKKKYRMHDTKIEFYFLKKKEIFREAVWAP